MARIKTVKGKRRTTYAATIRMKGFPSRTRTFDTKGEAKAWASEIEGTMRRGKYRDPRPAEKLLLEDAIDRYLQQITVRKKPTTQKRDRDCARALLSRLPRVSLAKTTPQILANYRDERLQSAGPSTIQKEFALLSNLFNIARREWGIQVENPVPDVRRPPVRNNRTRFLDHVEAQHLLDACKASQNKKLYPYVLLLMHTGTRPSEAAGLRWGQVDLQGRILTLHDTKTDPRRVPLTKEAAVVLADMQPQTIADDLPVFLPPGTSERVWLNPCQYFRKSWETARKQAKLLDVHLHDLRHTAASHLLMTGTDLRTLAEILGHKTMAMVQRYTHLLDDHKLAAVDRINSLGLN